MMIGRVWTGAVDASLGKDDELSGLYRQLDAILVLLIEVERISCVVETFFTAEPDRTHAIVAAASKSQAAAFWRSIVDRHPHRQLEDLAAIGRKDTRILVVFN